MLESISSAASHLGRTRRFVEWWRFVSCWQAWAQPGLRLPDFRRLATAVDMGGKRIDPVGPTIMAPLQRS
jgi:hypothetical protein